MIAIAVQVLCVNMTYCGFFSGPTVIGAMAASATVSCCFAPLTTFMWGVAGGIQGAMGAFVLTTLGISSASILTAAAIGALAGVAIAAPVALLMGVKWLFETSDNDDDEESCLGYTADFALRIGIISLASFALSTALFLGAIPAVSVATGAVITEAARFMMGC